MGTSASAGFLEDLGRTIAAPVTAPIESTIRILRGDNPRDAIIGPWQSPGRLIQQGSQQFQNAHNVFINVQRDAIRSTLGGDWVRAYDALTSSQRVQFELAMTSGRFLGKCLQGQPCSVQELAAAPLAAAMRDAYKAYIGHAVPLHPNIVRILSLVMPGNIAQSARVTVGAIPDLSVPGMLNAGHELFGRGHAMVLGNLVIFSRAPDLSSRADWNWLLHELRHIEQYAGYSNDFLESIDGFAVNYAQHFNSIENDAQAIADQRQANLNQICQYNC